VYVPIFTFLEFIDRFLNCLIMRHFEWLDYKAKNIRAVVGYELEETWYEDVVANFTELSQYLLEAMREYCQDNRHKRRDSNWDIMNTKQEVLTNKSNIRCKVVPVLN
jgi:hypothetical protein